jgi:syntaxin 8
MSLAKLTALSTQTLSLLLERQRLQSLSPAVAEGASNSSLHLPQITRNLAQLRSGILELESTGDHSEAVVLLRNQHVRMRGMVGLDAVIEPLPESTATQEDDPQAWEKPQDVWPAVGNQAFTPYTDDPEAGGDPVFVLQNQQRLMDGACCARLVYEAFLFNESVWTTDQDVHLDSLSRSITRQRDLSMQINDELEVHTGLLEELDHDLDDTGNRLGRARQRLGRVANGAKEHGEWGPVESLGWQLMERPRRISINHCAVDFHTVNLDNRLQDMTFFFMI